MGLGLGEKATLLSSGFDAVSTNKAQSPLDTPEIISLTNGITGQLLVSVKPMDNAKCYGVRCAAMGPGGTLGAWQTGGLFTVSRSMRVSGLTRGTDYTVQVRAIGGSTGYSDWSNPSSHMCM